MYTVFFLSIASISMYAMFRIRARATTTTKTRGKKHRRRNNERFLSGKMFECAYAFVCMWSILLAHIFIKCVCTIASLALFFCVCATVFFAHPFSHPHLYECTSITVHFVWMPCSVCVCIFVVELLTGISHLKNISAFINSKNRQQRNNEEMNV